MCLFLLTQKPHSDLIGTQIRDNISWWSVISFRTAKNSVTEYSERVNITSSLKPGQAVIKEWEEYKLFRVPLIKEEDISKNITKYWISEIHSDRFVDIMKYLEYSITRGYLNLWDGIKYFWIKRNEFDLLSKFLQEKTMIEKHRAIN